MKGKGPIVTLLVGVVFAAVLVIANANAAAKTTGAAQGATTVGSLAPVTPSSAPVASNAPSGPATTAPPATSPPVVARATYAGHTTASTASIAISIRDGVAIAYLCSGRIESWLKGTAADGKLTLTGTHHGTLTGTFTAQGAAGTATASGLSFPFTVGVVHAPSGLWRAAATVRKAKVLAGWIVLPDGTQIGMVNNGGVETRAPALSGTTHTAPVAGTTLTASPVDGETGDGF